MFSNIPIPPKRNNYISKFFTYIEIYESNRRQSIRWKSNLRLQRNIELYKNKHQEFSLLCDRDDTERELVRFFINMVLNDLPEKAEWELPNRKEIALEHLKFYGEESCYNAAREIWQKNNYLPWEEYLSIGRSFIYHSDSLVNILNKYNQENSLFSTYIKGVLINYIKDQTSVAKFGEWRLLCKEKDNILKEALLKETTYKNDDIAKFLFARKYFQQVYQINKVQNPIHRTGNKWPNPDSQDFQEAALLYNGEKCLSFAPREVYHTSDITGDRLQEWMNICIKALQNYTDKSITPQTCSSIEFLQEKGTEIGNTQPNMSIEEDVFLLAEETWETENIIEQIEPDLVQQFLSLKPEQQELVIMYYGCDWNQKQIANSLEIRQDAVSRRLETIKKKFIQTLTKLSQPQAWVIPYIEKWLVSNNDSLSTDLINIALGAAFDLIHKQEKEVLRLYYEVQQSEKNIARSLNISELEVMEILRRGKYTLEITLRKQIDIWIKDIMKIWLKNFSKSLVETVCDRYEILLISLKTAETNQINFLLAECLKELNDLHQGG